MMGMMGMPQDRKRMMQQIPAVGSMSGMGMMGRPMMQDEDEDEMMEREQMQEMQRRQQMMRMGR